MNPKKLVKPFLLDLAPHLVKFLVSSSSHLFDTFPEVTGSGTQIEIKATKEPAELIPRNAVVAKTWNNQMLPMDRQVG